jgi:hypothetical protein
MYETPDYRVLDFCDISWLSLQKELPLFDAED